MKQSKQAVSKLLLMAGVIGITSAVTGQESRTYRENFKVNPDVVVELNTSYADIEFETWNKNEVLVEATVELQGASAEEAVAYFGKEGVEILGNSSEVQVRTQAERWEFHFANNMDFNFEDFDVVVPEIPDVAPMVAEIMEQLPQIVSMPPMPPMPPMPKKGFDYEAYKKDGEKYMKKWQKEFEKEFDEEYREEFEAWKPRKARTVPANSARSDLQQLIDAITRATPPLHSHVLWHGQGKPPRRLNNPARSQNVLHVAERQDRTLLSLANRS